jgi:PGF-CTERM protein
VPAIRTPEEINEEFFMKYFWWDKKGQAHYKDFKISAVDWGVWGAALPRYVAGDPNLPILPVDTDKDGKPEILMPAVTDYMLRNTDLEAISDNIVYYTLPTGSKNIKYKTYYLLDPFHKPKNEDIPGILTLLYTNPDWKIVPLCGEDTVKLLYWKDLVGKTPAELGLDKDDRGIFGRTPSQTSSPAESTPSEVPTGEEKGIPGFEAIFAIAGLLAVAYILRRRDK